MGTPNHQGPLTNKTRTSRYNYQRIAKRHAAPKRSTSLQTVLAWILVAILAIVLIVRQKSQHVLPPSPSATLSQPLDQEAEPPEQAPPAADDSEFKTPSMPAQLDFAPPPPPPPHESQPSPESTRVRVVLQRDRSGNYFATGRINGKNVRLLADTGASIVVLPEKIAQQLGLKLGASTWVKTAGGVVQAYETKLDTLSLGRIEMHNVAAMISPSMQEDFALLGMNALGLLQFSQENDTLVLSYDPGKDGATEAESAPQADEKFQRSVKECMTDGKTIDKKTLDCLRGG